MRTDNRPRVKEQLADGSWLVEIYPTAPKDKQNADLPSAITLRKVEFMVEGHTTKYTLYTSLLDSKSFPAKALAELYHKRWEIELAFDELKTEMLLRKEALRSNLPARV
ncbi:MAG: hypothetical protein EOO38_24870, partial [Cytophagaceae bacterium]